MIDNPMTLSPAFTLGPVTVTWPVVTTWGVIAVLGLGSWAATRSLTLRPGKAQAVLELIVTALDSEIRATIPGDPARFRVLIGTLLLFVLGANWCSLIPGAEPPTAHLETDAALALIVFAAGIYWGIRVQGVAGWLAEFAKPSWVMIPLNLVEEITRHFSLMVRLFGNIMSGVFIIGIILSLAGLLVPVPLMALDLLTGTIQAYIFATLALVFIGAATGGDTSAQKEPPHE